MDMRTAEDILKSHYFRRSDPETDIDELITIINEARIEAIKECAEVAKTKTESFYGRDDKLHDREIVDEKSILSLIEQVK